MLEEVGIPQTVEYAKRLGVGSLPNVPSLALGSGEVTLISMTAAYGAFANEGLLTAPTLIRRVEAADGTMLYEAKPHAERAVSETTAFLITTMMADVIDAGTAWTARREGFSLPAAGKTGTTNDYHDAWFVGYTPNLVSGVWVGYDQPRTIIGNGYAAELAVPMWSRFMRTATRGDAPDWFEAPSTVTTAKICRLSGHLAGDGCRDAVTVGKDGAITRGSLEYTEYFVRGTEPTEYCPVHVRGQGQLATITASTPGLNGTAAAPVLRPTTPATIGSRPGTDVPAAAAPAPEPKPEKEKEKEKEKKRGFWGRLFGR
jgi:penicillin-binding protein 1A